MIELMPEYQYKKLNKLIEIEDNNYIVYDIKTKKFDTFKHKADMPIKIDAKNYQKGNKILIFGRSGFMEDVADIKKVENAIKNCSFSVSQTTKSNLLKYISFNSKLHFINNASDIIENIRISMKKDNNIQSKKYYNSILKQLKFTRLDILEKTDKQRRENLLKGVAKRDEELKYKKSPEYKTKQILENQTLDFY